MPVSPKNKALWLAGILITVVVLLFWQDSYRVRVRHFTIRDQAFAGVLSGKTIVHLSDPHFDRGDTAYMREILSRVAAIEPDMIVLTGDFVRWFTGHPDYAVAFELLAGLHAPLGVFAVMGDADYTLRSASCGFCHKPGSAEPPEQHQVRFLRDEWIEITVDGKTLRIAGLDCRQNMQPDLTIVDSLLAKTPTLLLSHTSLAWYRVPDNVPVFVFSGDTHGGQIWLPAFIWKMTDKKPDPDHMHGLFSRGRKYLYVSSGLGMTDVELRFGVPPEIAVFTFTGTSEQGRESE
ncbi:MAG TPA: hypothetical protein ENJ29_10630 [Bacteroidetes bacterium]|nr:hypothetical protein [Bacteroidota bacterium]